MIKWCNDTWANVVKKLNSNIYNGLKSDQVEKIQNLQGKNEITIPKSKGFPILFFKSLFQLWNIVLILISTMFYYQSYIIMCVILLIVIISNIFFIVLNEYKEEKSLKELEKLDSVYATVLRDKKISKILAEELVEGDIVFVDKGDIIPADLRIIENNSIKVREGAVTGEGYIVEKYETKIEEKELYLSEMRNILFKSSVIIDGSGMGIVVATGMNTKIANVISILFEEKNEKNFLKENLKELINKISIIPLILIILNVLYCFYYKNNIYNMLKKSSLIFIASIPEGIFIIITLVSIIILNFMNKKGVFFKNLSIIDTLSKILVICVDKVGFISENEMNLTKIFTSDKFIDVYEEKVKAMINDIVELNSDIERILKIGLLCNDTKISKKKILNNKNDMFEIALVEYGKENGINKIDLDKKYTKIFQIPFDTERRIMTTVNYMGEIGYKANVKGAVDTLIGKCTHIIKNGIEMPITQEDIKNIKKAHIKIANECLSTMGFAYRNFNYEPSLKENIESNLVFVGLIGFENPFKYKVKEAINECKHMGIKPIIITEDDKLTAFAQGKKAGIIFNRKEIISGVEIDNMDSREIYRNLSHINIFSRITAKHKTIIAKYYKDKDYSILMQGTRVTDLPSLKICDIGITSGKSNIVKKFSDIVLQDTDITKFLDVIKKSRKIINVIKKMFLYIFSCNMAEIFFILFFILLGYNVPIKPINILWINTISLVISCIALILNYKEEEFNYIHSSIKEFIFKENYLNIIFNGIVLSVISFISFYIGNRTSLLLGSTLSLIVFNISLLLFNYYYSNKIIFKNKMSNLIMIINIILQVLIVMFLQRSNKIFFTLYFWEYVFSIFGILSIIYIIYKKYKNNEKFIAY